MVLEDFCTDEFWDWELSWNTPNGTLPDFTRCFEETALLWGSFGFLMLFAPVDIAYSMYSRAMHVPRSPLSVTKYGLTILLMIAQLIILFFVFSDKSFEPERLYAVEYVGPLCRIAAYGVYWGLLFLSRYKGVQSSGVQFLFWLLHGIGEAVKFTSNMYIWEAFNANQQNTLLLPNEVLIVELICFPIVLGMLGLNCWADVRPKFGQDMQLSERPCPEAGSSFLSRILYEWFSSLALKGYRKPLDFSDLWDLNTEDKSRSIVPIFDKYWNRQLLKSAAAQEKQRQDKGSASYSKANGVDFTEKIKKKEEKQLASIMPALFGAFGTTFVFGSAMKIIPDTLAFVSPQILNLLIGYTTSSEPVWKGIFYAGVLFLSAFFSTMITAQYSHRMYLTGMRVRTVMVSAIYRKALLISNAAKRESTVGEIVNLMSVDIQKIMDLIPFVNMIWSAPLQIGIALYFLWNELGPSAMAGLAVMVLLLPANAVIATKSRRYQMQQLKKKDLRVKMMNEILSGIKVLKLYAWEKSFENQVMKIRAQEIEILKKAAYLQSLSTFLWTCAPFLVAISTFGTFVLSDSTNVLTAEKAFVSLSLFNIMSLPLTFLPMIIVFVVQANVSLARLNKYMNAEEIDQSSVHHDRNEADAIVVENGTFSWEPETITLRDINLRVKEGSLVAVVGQVGSGKSSLLSAFLGELDRISGRVNTKGSVAYVAQQAWIQNATLRNNIIFGRPYDPTKYDRVIENCALKPDLEILPAGDKTEIGEKGINLSGGQKQRVALARAVFNNADVYLLDDPLSAVDSHVGKHIFEKVIGPKGALKKKTRILVTHGIAYLPQVDNIIVLKDGEISEMGTYKELLERRGAFAEFLQQHITEEDVSQLEDPQLIQELQNVVGKKPRKVSETASDGSGTETSTRRRGVSITSQRQNSVDESSKRGEKMGSKIGKDKLIEIERSETDSVKLAVYVDYLRAAGWHMSVGTIVLYFLFQAFSIGSNLWLSEWSNKATVSNGTENVDLYLGVYAGFGMCQAIFIMIAALTMALGTLRSASNLHMKMLGRILQAPMSFFDTTPVGRIVNRFAKDVDVCDSTLPFNLRMWLNALFSVLATLVVISYTTPLFLPIILIVSVVYYFVQRFYVSSSRQLKRLESVTRSPIYSQFQETITGSTTIRAYGAQERFILESEAKVDHNQVSYFPAIVANRWLSVRLETIGNTIIFFAALLAVLGRDNLNSGLVGLSVSYALQITMALNMLVRWTSDVETNIVAVERMKEYGDAPQEAAYEIPDRKPPKTWPELGRVKFDNYQTRYRTGLDLVLRNVTCTINPGEKIGIVGRTGAGKSSLTLALFRIIEPANGTIIIDGQDISRLGLHDVRGRITIIPQDPVLFSGTLRINLDPFEQYRDETIWHALELAHLKSFVKSLSAGLAHEVSEGGENLSVGQRQLICLARALLRKTKILVLDEATAAVDLETDDLIQETIRTEFRDCTVLVIAHRLNTIMDSTRIMVLDAGTIKEMDTPQNLLNDPNSIFSSMAKDAGL